MYRIDRWGWITVALVLSALAIPWFLWGDERVVAGFPLWLWWHIGWMLLASIVFWIFAERAWGVGIEPKSTDRAGDDGSTLAAASEGGDQP